MTRLGGSGGGSIIDKCFWQGAEDEVAREAQRPTVLRATEALPRKGAG